MTQIPWRPIAYTAFGVLFLVVVYAPDPNDRTFSTLSNDELIEQLASPRDPIRRAAAGQLIARAKTVVPDLVDALPESEDNLRRVLFEILEELMLSNDQEVAESSESALERLAAGADQTLVDLAARILIQNATLRHARAAMTLTELGGRLERVSSTREVPREAVSFGRASQQIVLFDENWRGGDQGLRYLMRIFPGDWLALHLSEQAPISEAAIARLRTQRERLIIRRENDGCLGIIINPQVEADRVTVAGVVRNSPADRAGIRIGDVLLDVAGTPVAQFEDVGRELSQHSPGEYVRVTLHRQQQTVRLRLALGTDFRISRCQCLD